MTLHCLIAEPPEPGRSLANLAEGRLGDNAAAALHEAMLADTMRAVERSGGDLLVNFPPANAESTVDSDPESALRAVAEPVLDSPEAVRYEVQVGSSFAARAGNAATHLLEEEGVDTVAIMRGTAPTVDRTVLDGAAMQLRRHELVIGPGTGGREAYLGLSAPIDFTDAYAPPEIETLASRGMEADYAIAFLGMHPVAVDEAGVVALVSVVRARQRAGRNLPTRTAAVIEELGLRVVETDGGRRIHIE